MWTAASFCPHTSPPFAFSDHPFPKSHAFRCRCARHAQGENNTSRGNRQSKSVDMG